MAKREKVFGIAAPAVRPTAYAALLLALVLSIPVFVILTLVDLLI